MEVLINRTWATKLMAEDQRELEDIFLQMMYLLHVSNMNDLDIHGYAAEALRVVKDAGLNARLLPKPVARCYIKRVTDRFSPHKLSGHLAIQVDSVSVPLEPYEFSYPKYLDHEPIYMFFDQSGIDKDNVVVIKNGRALGEALSHSFGMEYFLSNKNIEFLLAVNWYVIEGAGTAKKWINGLIS